MSNIIVHFKNISECPNIIRFPKKCDGIENQFTYIRNSKDYIEFISNNPFEKKVNILDNKKAVMLEIHHKNPNTIEYTFFIGNEPDKQWINKYINWIKLDINSEIIFDNSMNETAITKSDESPFSDEVLQAYLIDNNPDVIMPPKKSYYIKAKIVEIVRGKPSKPD